MRAQEFTIERKKRSKKSRGLGGYFFPGYGYYGGSGDAGEGGGDGGGGGESTHAKQSSLTPKDIHQLANRKGVKWDNEPSFMQLTKRLTGKEHLDDLDQEGLQQVKQHLEKQQ